MLKIIGIILAALIVLVLVFIGILTVTEDKPADEETAEIAAGQSGQESVHVGDTLRVVTWNIGYGALGDNADFFIGWRKRCADGGPCTCTEGKTGKGRLRIRVRIYE